MKVFRSVRAVFLKKDGEKDILNKKRLFLFLGMCISLVTAFMVILGSTEDSSVVASSMEPFDPEVIENVGSHDKSSEYSGKVSGLFQASAEKERETSLQRRSRLQQRPAMNIEYKAPQVIERKGPDGFASGLPIGSNLVGKLLTSIDTRETRQLYKVLLPYGGRDRNGGSIPKNSILFGTITYPGKGTKVFMQFTKALLPDGAEMKLSAQALSSKDYSPGIEGDFHGKTTERVVSTLGLTMVSAMTDTLTEREAIGNGEISQTHPKATAKNALYQGLSKVSEMEAQRRAEEMNREPEYLTVPAGKEMIVNLVATYYGGK